MNCFCIKKWWALNQTQNPSNMWLENWNLGLWEKIIALKWVIVSLKVNILRSPELQWWVPVSGKCLWLVYSELFEERRYRLLKRLIWGGKEGYGYSQNREFQWKNNQRKINSESHICQNVSGMFLSIG